MADPKPLTDEELAELDAWFPGWPPPHVPLPATRIKAVHVNVGRLVAEVRRLRDRVLELEDDVHSDRGAGGPAPGHPPDCRHCRQD